MMTEMITDEMMMGRSVSEEDTVTSTVDWEVVGPARRHSSYLGITIIMGMGHIAVILLWE